MIELPVSVREFVDDAQPGWVRVVFDDIDGKQWSIIEKIPIVTDEYLDEQSLYPRPGIITGAIVNTYEPKGQEIVVIDLSKPYNVCAEDGTDVFRVFKKQLEIK